MELKKLPGFKMPDESILKKLHEYCSLLHETNEKVRLVGPRDEEILWKEHILDCLHLLPLLPEKGKVIDVGTGGGLPGAVLAICRPDLEFTLLDSLSRKTNALSEIVRKLDIGNAEVVCSRSEDFSALHREQFDCAVIRAVSEAGVICEYLAPLITPGGCALAMKGSAIGDELDPLCGKWTGLGFDDPELYQYEIAGHPTYLLVWNKATPCPAKYPRRPGRAEKRPWWR